MKNNDSWIKLQRKRGYDDEIIEYLEKGKCPWCNLGRGPCTSGFSPLPKTYVKHEGKIGHIVNGNFVEGD